MSSDETIPVKLSSVPRQKAKKNQAKLESELEKITANPPPTCYYCPYTKFKNKADYEKHVLTKHNGKLCYPGLVDIEALKIRAQGMPWEI